MKAVIINQFGAEEVMLEADVPKPVIAEDQVLVKVAAASVNPVDMEIREGTLPGMTREFPRVLGFDYSGTVVEVGHKVGNLRVGDAVMGSTPAGSYAEYVAVDADQTVKLPAHANLVEAAALPMVGATAWYGVIIHGQAKSGDRVLIHGGAGGVGQMAIQFAKRAGAYVITTTSEENPAYLAKIGADEVVNYKTTDFSKVVTDIDLVLDAVGGETLIKSFGVLKKGGRLISVAMPPDEEQATAFQVDAKFIIADESPDVLNKFVDGYISGEYVLNIEKQYPFSAAGIRLAHKELAAGHSRGKRVIVMG